MEQPIPGQEERGAVPPGPPMPDEQPPEAAVGEGQQASPEEQALYEHFIAKAYELIYDRAMLPKIIDMLGGEGDPMEGLARASAMIIKRLMDLAESAGEKLSGDVILHAGTEVFEDLANLAKVAKIKDFSADQDSFEGAYFKMLDQLRTMLQESGKLDQQAAAKDLDTLMKMDQGGKLEELFQGLAAGDDENQAEPAENEPAEGKPPQGAGLMGAAGQEVDNG